MLPTSGRTSGSLDQSDARRSRILLCISKRQHAASASLFSRILDESLCAVLEFVGQQQFRFIVGVNRHLCHAYLNSWDGASTSTSITVDSCSPQQAQILLDDELFNRQLHRRHTTGDVCLDDEQLKQCLHFRLAAYDACCLAAKHGMLKCLRQHGCQWNEFTCSHAAANGHLEVLQWARNCGCAWDETTCAFAAENGHLKVLQWARRYGCDWEQSFCSDAAAKNGHLDVKRLIRSHGGAFLFGFNF